MPLHDIDPAHAQAMPLCEMNRDVADAAAGVEDVGARREVERRGELVLHAAQGGADGEGPEGVSRVVGKVARVAEEEAVADAGFEGGVVGLELGVVVDEGAGFGRW